MSIDRVAVVFDDQIRPETTGVYCRRALDQLVRATHFRPSEVERISPIEFDLILCIDDGLDYPIPARLRPAAFWAIDTHIDFEAAFDRSCRFDFVFAAQRDGAERFRQKGIAAATWLPLACDPTIHQKHDVAKEFDVAFVGNDLPGARSELLRLIRRHFGKSFVGQRYFDDMARTYSASRIVFNRSVKNDINMRVFEALACGSMLLTNDLDENGQSEIFRVGRHLETYRDSAELLDKIRFFLDHDESRERIAAAGRQVVLDKHTYRHRMTSLLEIIERAGPSGLISCNQMLNNGKLADQPRVEPDCITSNETCSSHAPVSSAERKARTGHRMRIRATRACN
jgi:hypothetical protein